MAKRPKPDHCPDQLTVEIDDPFSQILPLNLAREPADQERQKQGKATIAPGPLLPVSSLLAMRSVGGEAAMVDAGESAAIVANESLKPIGMQIYWNLSSLNMAVREAAAVALVGELRANQEDFISSGGQEGIAEVLGAKENVELLEGCAPGVQYALRRLVRGLGSSRECARQGFATALTAVIGALPVIRGEALLRIIPSNLEVTSSMKKQEARDGLLGRLFAYGSMIRSRRLVGNCSCSEEKELAIEIIQQLFNLAKRKTFLREPAVSLVIEVASRMRSSAVRETVCAAPLFDAWLRRDVENQSADALVLVLHLYDKLLSSSSPLLPESGNFQDFFEPSHLAKLVPCLKESSSSHPRIHSVWHLLLDRLFFPLESATKSQANFSSLNDVKDVKKVTENLTNFWRVVVDGALLLSSYERKNLAMELLLLVLPRLPTPESVGIVLSNVFVRCILDILSSKDTYLHKSAQKCLGELRLWAERENSRRIAVIGALQRSSSGKFDTLSKSLTVKSLTNGLISEDGALDFVYNLQELFISAESSVVMASEVTEQLAEGSEDTPMSGRDSSRANDRIWIIEQMHALCRQVKLEPKTQRILYREVIQFLIVHSLFHASSQQNVMDIEKETIKWPHNLLTENIRKLCAERLLSVLVDAEHWMSTQKSRSIKAGLSGVNNIVTEDEDFSLFAASYCNSVQGSPTAVLVQPLKVESAESVKLLHQTLSTLSLAIESETNVDKSKRLLAMRTLLSNIFLQSFLEPGSIDDIAAELVICCSKAFSNLPELSKIAASIEENVENKEVPPVMAVLLDALLSMLAKSSTPIRNAVEQVFKAYCEDLTGTELSDILRIINKGLKSGRHKSLLDDGDENFDDDDILEDVEESEGGVEEGIQEATEEGEGEDCDEDDEDEEEAKEDIEMGDVDTEARTLQQQMRFKRPREDFDDEAEGSDLDLSDMDDEAMFRADSLLANVLTNRKEASKSTAQTQLTHFKFRVLSLLEYFLQKHPSSSLVLLSVHDLLRAFVCAINQLGTASEENEILAKRLESMLLTKVLHAKKYPKGEDVDLPLARALLKKLLKLASRSSIKRIRKLAEACTLWTLKVLLANVPDTAEKCDTEMLECISTALDDYFTQKKSRLAGSLFIEIFQRHQILGRFSIGKLIEKCGNGRTEFMKCEALRLLTVILKPVTPGKGKKTVAESVECNLLAKAFQQHMGSLGAAISFIVRSPPEKSAYKSIALQFCSSCIDVFTLLYPLKGLHSLLDSKALLAGLEAIDAPSKGKLHNLITKLQNTVTEELTKTPAITDPTKKSTNKIISNKTNRASESPTVTEKVSIVSKTECESSEDSDTSCKKMKERGGEATMEGHAEDTFNTKQKGPSFKKVKLSNVIS